MASRRTNACLRALGFILLLVALIALMTVASIIHHHLHPAHRDTHDTLTPLSMLIAETILIAGTAMATVIAATFFHQMAPPTRWYRRIRPRHVLTEANLSDARWLRHVLSGALLGFSCATGLIGLI